MLPAQGEIHWPPPPASRASDPSTSHEAEAAVTASGQRESECARLLELVLAEPWFTYRDYHARYERRWGKIEAVEIQRRLNDLAPRTTAGEPAPGAKLRRGKRRPSTTGMPAQSWGPVNGKEP